MILDLLASLKFRPSCSTLGAPLLAVPQLFRSWRWLTALLCYPELSRSSRAVRGSLFVELNRCQGKEQPGKQAYQSITRTKYRRLLLLKCILDPSCWNFVFDSSISRERSVCRGPSLLVLARIRSISTPTSRGRRSISSHVVPSMADSGPV